MYLRPTILDAGYGTRVGRGMGEGLGVELETVIESLVLDRFFTYIEIPPSV